MGTPMALNSHVALFSATVHLDAVTANMTAKNAYRYCVEEVIDTTGLHEPGEWHIIWNAKAVKHHQKSRILFGGYVEIAYQPDYDSPKKGSTPYMSAFSVSLVMRRTICIYSYCVRLSSLYGNFMAGGALCRFIFRTKTLLLLLNFQFCRL
jgi:hypothetical protein